MAKISPIDVAIRAVDQFSAPMRRFNDRVRQASAPVRKLSNSLAALKRESGIAALGKRFSELQTRVVGVKDAVVRLGLRLAALGAGTIGGLYALSNSTAAAGDEIAKTAERIGFGVEALQEFRYAADRSGVSAGTFDTAMQRFGRRAAEAANGTGEAREALKKLGLELTDAQGKMRPVEDLFLDAADALSKIEDPLTRNALAMKLFDSEGVKLVQMMKDGSAGIEELREEARQMGLVLSEDAARGAESFIDAQTNLSAAMSGLKNIIGAELMPVFTDLMNQSATWLASNGPEIKAFMADFAARLPDRLRAAREAFGEFMTKIDPLIEMLKGLYERIGPVGAAATVLAVTIGGPAITALAGLLSVGGSLITTFTALAKTTGALLTALKPLAAGAINPVTVAVGGLAAAAYLWITRWDEIKQGLDAVSSWQGVKETFQGWRLAMEEACGVDPIKPFVQAWEAAKRALERVWDTIRQTFATAAGALERSLAPLIGPLVQNLENAWNETSAFFTRIWNGLKQVFSLNTQDIARFVEDIGSSLVTTVKNAWNGVAAFFTKLWEGVVKVFEEAWGRIQGIIDKVSEAVGKITALGDKVSEIGQTTVTYWSDKYKQLTGKAAGGPVSAGRTYLVGEEGPELFTPSSSGRIIPNHDLFGPPLGSLSAGGGGPGLVGAAPAGEARVAIRFENAPRGTRVVQSETRGTALDLSLGYAMTS